MGPRITTWNVNGIRNPFGFKPWRDKRSYEDMFEILEADIVVLQELKIQRKDLKDDMVLVPGWDCFFSLPKHKKGYSGVGVYTRQAVCAPTHAEEGITGILSAPGSSVSYKELPEEQRIGGYPTDDQLASGGAVDAATLDSEGRAIVLAFPAFVLIGVYSPANRDETRDDFRLGFLNALDARVRNLTCEGKRVILTGDLNISREELDTANAASHMRKRGMSEEDYLSSPARRLLNHLLVGGKIIGDRDIGRENAVLWDLCRGFHQGRKGMFTCWEQKVNARPSNFGSRIDYVLCSYGIKDWFCDSNIQEGLMGSDHCPVYAEMKDVVLIQGCEIFILDLMNPSGVFKDGRRIEGGSTNSHLALSGRLLQEFNRRRSIRDMFTAKPFDLNFEFPKSPPTSNAGGNREADEPTKELSSRPRQNKTDDKEALLISPTSKVQLSTPSTLPPIRSNASKSGVQKRPAPEKASPRSLKRSRSGASAISFVSTRGQQSLKGFFQTNAPERAVQGNADGNKDGKPSQAFGECLSVPATLAMPVAPFGTKEVPSPADTNPNPENAGDAPPTPSDVLPQTFIDEAEETHDPIVAKESWSKLFSKRPPPRCESHQEPCISLTTKKSGVNCGRAFWICPRPLGPTGMKERDTAWRCGTFIWASDWN